MTVVCYRNIWWRESDFRIFSGACTLRFYGPMLEVWYFELTNKLGFLLLSDACWNYLLRCMIGSNVLACQCATLRTVSCSILVGLLFGLHSVFHFFLWTRRATSAITHVVLGQFKTCVLLLGNYYLFGSNQGKTSICGAFTAIAGMSYYTYLNLNQKPSKTSPRQAASLPISRLSKENGSMHDGNYGGESVKQDA